VARKKKKRRGFGATEKQHRVASEFYLKESRRLAQGLKDATARGDCKRGAELAGQLAVAQGKAVGEAREVGRIHGLKIGAGAAVGLWAVDRFVAKCVVKS
jgi:hypothetical protein